MFGAGGEGAQKTVGLSRVPDPYTDLTDPDPTHLSTTVNMHNFYRYNTLLNQRFNLISLIKSTNDVWQFLSKNKSP
jgi:hypothetical protein